MNPYNNSLHYFLNFYKMCFIWEDNLTLVSFRTKKKFNLFSFSGFEHYCHSHETENNGEGERILEFSYLKFR